MPRHARITAGLSVAVTMLFASQAAFADSQPGAYPAPDAIAATIDAVAPQEPAADTRVPVDQSSREITAAGESLDIVIPAKDSGQVTLSRPGSKAGASVGVGLPSAGAQANAVVGSDGTVAYDTDLPGTNVAVQAFEHSVRVQTVISDAAAPTEFTYPVDVPPGGSLSLSPDGGVLILGADGLPQGGFAAPWAKDATGADISTRYEIRGTDVVQIVEHADATYPVVADPWFWIDLIDHASWRRDPAHGWTLMVTPTWWARAQAGGYAPGAAGWDELYSKYKNLGLNTNLDGMRDQYICHQQIVAIRDPLKPTWNLDEWRPNVSYLQTLNTSCNPGGPALFD